MKNTFDFETERERLGKKIRSLRKGMRMTQVNFAEAVGIDRTYLIAIEQGKRNASIDTMMAIAHTLGMNMSQLFEGIDEVAL